MRLHTIQTIFAELWLDIEFLVEIQITEGTLTKCNVVTNFAFFLRQSISCPNLGLNTCLLRLDCEFELAPAICFVF